MKIKKGLFGFKWMNKALIMSMILTGCVHSDELLPPAPEAVKQGVKVTILRNLPTRSGIDSQPHVGNGSTTVLSNGYLYFTDLDGNILLCKKIDKEADVSDVNTISLKQLQTTGAIINDTPENANYCYVALNIPAAGFEDKMALESGNISSIEKLAVNTNNLYDSNGGINKIPLWGMGGIIESTSESYYAREAKVNLRTIGSRIEILKISSVPSKEILDEHGKPYEINSFKVAGIFINNFFSTSQLDGLTTPASQVLNSEKNVFSGTEDTPDTPYRNYLELFTYNNTSTGISHSVTDAPNVLTPPQQKYAWAYNIFPNDTNGVNTSIYLPHIIIRFSQITYRPQGSLGQGVTLNDQFITIGGYISGGVELQYLTKGWIYSFSNLSFSLDEISPDPERKMVKIDVEASVIPWFVEQIAPPSV